MLTLPTLLSLLLTTTTHLTPTTTASPTTDPNCILLEPQYTYENTRMTEFRKTGLPVTPFHAGFSASSNDSYIALGCLQDAATATVRVKREEGERTGPCQAIYEQQAPKLEMIQSLREREIKVPGYLSGYFVATREAEGFLGCSIIDANL